MTQNRDHKILLLSVFLKIHVPVSYLMFCVLSFLFFPFLSSFPERCISATTRRHISTSSANIGYLSNRRVTFSWLFNSVVVSQINTASTNHLVSLTLTVAREKRLWSPRRLNVKGATFWKVGCRLKLAINGTDKNSTQFLISEFVVTRSFLIPACNTFLSERHQHKVAALSFTNSCLVRVFFLLFLWSFFIIRFKFDSS